MTMVPMPVHHKLSNLMFNLPDCIICGVDLVIPDSVAVIETASFQDCVNLEEVILPSGLKELHYQVFECCKSLKKVTLPEGLETIMYASFSYCSQLQEIVIPQNVQEIGKMAFAGCNNLIEVGIPDTVSKISGDAFVGTPWYEARTEEFVEMGNHVLVKYNGKESKIEIPKETRYIGEYVFSKTKDLLSEKQRENITQIIVPESVEGIGFLGILELVNLETVILYNDEINLAEQSIEDCDKLTIVAREGSNGHKYAEENHIPWQELEE